MLLWRGPSTDGFTQSTQQVFDIEGVKEKTDIAQRGIGPDGPDGSNQSVSIYEPQFMEATAPLQIKCDLRSSGDQRFRQVGLKIFSQRNVHEWAGIPETPQQVAMQRFVLSPSQGQTAVKPDRLRLRKRTDGP